MPRPATHPEFELPILAKVSLAADGTYKMRPLVAPGSAGDTWISTARAAGILGWSEGVCCSKTQSSRMARLRDRGIVRYRRVSPRTYEYELGSLMELKGKMEDTEYQFPAYGEGTPNAATEHRQQQKKKEQQQTK